MKPFRSLFVFFGRLFGPYPTSAVWLSLVGFGLFGGIAGLGGFTFSYANGFSYLSDDPAACANCHVMRDVFDAWNSGSHKAVATCNDCHVPHSSEVAKYVAKGLNGFRHSSAFTLGGFPEPIQITPADRQVVNENCLRCHGSLVQDISHENTADVTDCLRCHNRVGHDQ